MRNIIVIVLLIVFGLIFLTGNSSAKIIADNALVEFPSGIIFDPVNPDKQPTNFVAGEKVTVRVPISRLSDCGDCTVSLKSDSADVMFQNIIPKTYYLEAIMVISPNIGLGRNVLITAETEHNGWVRSINSSLMIVSNTPPKVEPDYPIDWSSFTAFSVNCNNSTSGNGFNEGGDRVWRCKVTVLDENGNVISPSPREKTAKPGRTIPLISVKTGTKGVNKIIVEVEDTLGAVSVYNGLVNVDMGTTGKDIPAVYINNSIVCYAREECVLDASETKERDDDVSLFNYYIVKDGREIGNLSDPQGIPCKSSICRHIFNNTGIVTIKVTANYFRQNKLGFNTVTVTVKNRPLVSQTISPARQAVQPHPTMIVATSPPLATQIGGSDGCEGYRCKTAPGLGLPTVIFALAILARRIKQNK